MSKSNTLDYFSVCYACQELDKGNLDCREYCDKLAKQKERLRIMKEAKAKENIFNSYLKEKRRY